MAVPADDFVPRGSPMVDQRRSRCLPGSEVGMTAVAVLQRTSGGFTVEWQDPEPERPSEVPPRPDSRKLESTALLPDENAEASDVAPSRPIDGAWLSGEPCF